MYKEPKKISHKIIHDNTFAILLIQDFVGNTDEDTVVSHDLNPPIMARFIRFRSVSFHGHMSMRVEVYGCKGNVSQFFCPRGTVK